MQDKCAVCFQWRGRALAQGQPGMLQPCPGSAGGWGGDQVRAGRPAGTALPPAVCNSDIQWPWPSSQPGGAQPATEIPSPNTVNHRSSSLAKVARCLRVKRQLQSQSITFWVAVKSARCICGHIWAVESSILFCVWGLSRGWGSARVGDSTELPLRAFSRMQNCTGLALHHVLPEVSIPLWSKTDAF